MESIPAQQQGDLRGRAPDRPPAKSRFGIAVLAIGICGTVLQLCYLWTLRDQLTFAHPIVDERSYHDHAQRLVSGTPVANPQPYFQPPLYAYLLAVVYLGGAAPLVMKIVQCAVFGLTCGMVAVVGRRLGSAGCGLAAALATLCCGPLMFFAGRLLPVVWITMLFGVILLAMSSCVQRDRWWTWLCLGVAIGVGSLLRGDLLLLLLPAAAAALTLPPVRDRFAERLCLLGWAAALPILPVSLRNTLVAAEPVLISTNAGVNLFIGNNPEMDQTIAVRPGQPWMQLLRQPLRSGIRSPAGQDHYFRREVRAFVAREPLAFLQGLWRKARWAVHGRELPRNVSIYSQRDDSPLLALAVWQIPWLYFPSGVILPLAAAGMICNQLVRRHWLTWSSILLYGSVMVLFFPAARYRVPLLPWLLLYAMVGVVSLIGYSRLSARWCIAGVVTVVLAILANKPVHFPTDDVDFRTEALVAVGSDDLRHDRFDRAGRLLEAAIASAPEHPDPPRALGYMYLIQGSPDRAEPLLRRAVELYPDSPEAHYYLGLTLRALSRAREARQHLARAAALDSTQVHLRLDYGQSLIAAGTLDEANAECDAVLRMKPHDPRAHYNKSVVLTLGGRCFEAWWHLSRARRQGIMPPDPFVVELQRCQPNPFE